MKKILTTILFVLLLAAPANALDTSAMEAAVPEVAREIMGDADAENILDGGAAERVRSWCQEQITKLLTEAGRNAGIALTTALLCSAAAAVSPGGRMPGYVLLGGSLAILGSCMGDMRSFLSQTGSALDDLSDFSRALLPCVAAASAAAGQPAAGAARYTVSALFMDVLMTLGRNIVLPSIYGYGAIAAANAALPDGALGGPVKLVKWLCTTVLTLLTTVFTMMLTVTGMIAGGAEKVACSAAKTAITAALPVVGKIVADAADTYLAGAKLVRNAVGAFGLTAVLCICLGPLLRLGLHYLLFRAAACIAEPFADRRLSELLGNIASGCGMALGLVGSAGFMLFVSIVLGTEALSG